MKKLIAICSPFIFLFFGFLAVNNVLGQETPEKLAEKYDITFPVSELGGCKNYSECRTYCEDPVNFDSCKSFALSKGFYEEENLTSTQVLQKAKSVLGCDSTSSCKDFCSEKENFEKCHSFAQKSGVSGGYVSDPRSSEILNKARQTLGCTSYNSCRDLCDNPLNRDTCAKFAQSVGMSGGYEYKGPGGCTSEQTCRSFCENPSNFEICKQYSSSYGGEEFVGPGGCRDGESCKAYCEKNPSSCNYARVGGENYDPKEVCSRTPACKWQNNSCQCGVYEGGKDKYCREHPEFCQTDYDPKAQCTKYTGCSWTGSYCQCSGQYDQERAKTECTKYTGCAWTGTSCQCSQAPTYSGGTMSREEQETTCKSGGGTCTWSGDICNCQGYKSSGSSYTPYPYKTTYPYSSPSSGGGYYYTPYPTSYYSGNTMTKEQQESTCKSGGGTCTWVNDVCNCQGYNSGGSSGTSYTPAPTNDPAAACNAMSGCSWTGSGCYCPPVQGAETEGLFQSLINFLISLLGR